MGRVITSCFGRRLDAAYGSPAATQAQDHPPPLFSDAEIWARDYSLADSVVFGVCAVAEILSRHLGRDGRWPALLLDLLKDSARQPEEGPHPVSRSARDLKDLILSSLSRKNSQDFSAALLIVDLIEYTPKYRTSSGT
ncbi:MAG: hypothetical protein GYA47_02085 [Desulfovibrio sp.]|nr:hypothetical protein [Desulfovibrio sp.]